MKNKYFTLYRIKYDLFDYLYTSPYYEVLDGVFYIELVESYSKEILIDEVTEISSNDLLTLFSIQSLEFYIYDDFYYKVQIIIGEYNREYEQGLIHINKCFATMKYTSDFKLIDIVFHKEE